MSLSEISICLPYFERPRNLRLSLECYRKTYGEQSGLEINIVDDGSMSSPARPIVREFRERTGMNVRDEFLGPPKDHILCPVVPYNLCVAMASRDIIVITGPEMMHETPVLEAMLERQKAEGRDAIICPSVWNDYRNEWICHGVHERSGYQFCIMMYRSLFGLAGGLDLDYRFGHCADDNDFIQRLLHVGARYVFMDDVMVVHHGEHGDERVYDPRLRARNVALLNAKWPEKKNI